VASDTLPIGNYLRQLIAAGLMGAIAGAALVLWNER